MTTSRGRFITLEGIEGAGKSTQVQVLQRYFLQRDIDVCLTREPGGTPMAEKIRALLLDPNSPAMAADTELLLLFAARADHLANKIRPALSKGQWVVSDRFTDASYAYQGAGRGVDQTRIHALEQWTQRELRPDLVLLLDLPAQDGLRRAASRSSKDRFESETLEFFHRTRECYLRRAAEYPERYQIIDARKPVETVGQQVVVALDRFMAGIGPGR